VGLLISYKRKRSGNVSTINAISLICCLNESSSLESTFSGKARDSHHLQAQVFLFQEFVADKQDLTHKGNTRGNPLRNREVVTDVKLALWPLYSAKSAMKVVLHQTLFSES
jgi:hypothetical protein